MASTDSAARSLGWRRGWPIVLSPFLGVSLSSIAPCTLGLVVQPLSHEFGWSRTQITAVITLGALIAIPFSPVVGALFDRFGTRYLALPGIVLAGLGCAGISLANGSTTQWFILWGFFWIAESSIKVIIWSAAVMAAFNAARSMALSITLCGVAFSSVVVPPLMRLLVDNIGWREGYAGYGFCEAHAAAFGDTAIRTAHLLKHHPAEFYAALLNNQPMGFYSPATIVNEARIRGIQLLPPDVQSSEKEFTIRGKAILVGLKQVKGIRDTDIEEIIKNRLYHTWVDFLARARLPRDLLENLVLCGACSGFNTNRRALLFSLGTALHLDGNSMALPLNLEPVVKTQSDFNDYDRMAHEWNVLGFSPWCHPLEFWREQLSKSGVLPNNIIRAETDKTKYFRAAGWVIRPHTPPTKSGKTVVFFTLEDETGLMNITTFPDMYERYGHLIFSNPLLIIEGKKDRRGANSLIVERMRKIDEHPVSMMLNKFTHN